MSWERSPAVPKNGTEPAVILEKVELVEIVRSAPLILFVDNSFPVLVVPEFAIVVEFTVVIFPVVKFAVAPFTWVEDLIVPTTSRVATGLELFTPTLAAEVST